MKEKRRVRKIPYKAFVYLCVFALVMTLVILFAAFRIYNFRQESREVAAREAGYTARRVVSDVDERLDNLWQYYLKAATDEAVNVLLKKKPDELTYDSYHRAQELLANAKIFGDYINGYAFINFRSGVVLSNKGMYLTDEMYNLKEVKQIFNTNNSDIDKNFWYYDGGSQTTSNVSRNYRTTIDTKGLNIAIKLPSYSSAVYGMIIVNVNMNVWRTWIDNLVDDYEVAIVTDADGSIIYSSNEAISAKMAEDVGFGTAWEGVFYQSEGGTGYMVSSAVSNVRGWKYFILRDVNSGISAADSFDIVSMLAIGAVIILVFSIVAYIVYKPIRSLIKNVSDADEKLQGNELDFLANRFADISGERRRLQQTLGENKKKIQELFELRLIRGEVRSEDEWNEYFSGLHMDACKYFATAVMVINLKGEFGTEDNMSEDSMCLRIVEDLPDELNNLTWMPLVYNACTMFCIFGADDEDTMLNRIMMFHNGIQEYTQKRFGLRILMGVSATHTEHKHIYAAYRESINALTMQKDSDTDKNSKDCHFYLSSFTERTESYNYAYESMIHEAIKAVDKDQCYRVIDEFSKYITELTSTDDINYMTTRMINAILDAASSTNLTLSKVFPEGIRKNYREMLEAAEPSRVRRYLKYALIDPILEARNAKLEDSTEVFIEKIEAFIDSSSGNVSMTECADKLGVHPTYIWKVLKMERGMAFGEFLEAYKIKKAKDLLLKSSKTVNEISDELGYVNPQTFSRIFAKETGVSPVKFRKLY